MSRRRSQSLPGDSGRTPDQERARPGRLSLRRLVSGVALLLVAAGASTMMALRQVGLATLPGCGPRSACAEAAGSTWATIPFTSWPTAFFGGAYFLALLLLWFGSRRGLPARLLPVIRLGGFASLGLLLALIAEGHFCVYCLVTHTANLAFWGIAEASRRDVRLSPRLIVAAATAFLAVSVSWWGIERHGKQQVEARGETELARSTSSIIAGDASVETSSEQGFRGRYLLGPDRAAVRLVVFTDYQCEDCRMIEEQIERLLERHEDVSLSVKHFPYCLDCNPTVDRTLHGNACWAARAAETAGILWGNEGFWAMHRWLFAQQGLFTSTEQIEQGLRSLGFDPGDFVELMMGSDPLIGIAADIEEARSLGLFQTPMIFVNGVELRGWHVRDAVVRAVEAVLSAGPEASTHAGDRPPIAVAKCVEDWRAPSNPRRSLPGDRHPLLLGSSRARVRVVVFGDYREPTSAEADRLIRAWSADHGDARYEFRPYPFDRSCNPHVSETRFPGACRAARTAEAANLLGGVEAYRAVHDWLMSGPESLDAEILRAACARFDLDVDALLTLRDGGETGKAVAENVAIGRRLGIRQIPTIFVNERQVVRWRWLGEVRGGEILHAILDAASREP